MAMFENLKNNHLSIFFTLSFGVITQLLWMENIQGEKLPFVTTKVVTSIAIQQNMTAMGSLTPNQSINITSQVDGRVDKTYMKESGSVKKRETLIVLDQRQQLAQVEEAKAALNESKRQLTFMRKLLNKNAISQDEVDSKAAELDRLTAILKMEESILSYYTITAPFSGVLGFHDISNGAYITTGTPLTTLDDLSSMKLTFSLPENVLSKIDIGSIVEATTHAWPKQ